MATTIQVTETVKAELDEIKSYKRQTYNEVIQKLIDIFDIISEDKELRGDVLRDINEAKKEIRQGKGITTEQLLKNLGITNDV
ncbi:MAG: hypothetical protein J4432_01845 [DPANN group archaeon]|nr:hypothetical protein [DPANN group archaeon]